MSILKTIFVALIITNTWAYENVPQYKTGQCITPNYKIKSHIKKVLKINKIIDDKKYFVSKLQERNNSLFLLEDVTYRSPAGQVIWEDHGTTYLDFKNIDHNYNSTDCPL
jgi:hypothetical protein